MKNIPTLEETKKMSKTQIRHQLGDLSKKLENLGLNHVDACEFIGYVMRLGVVLHEKNQSEEK